MHCVCLLPWCPGLHTGPTPVVPCDLGRYLGEPPHSTPVADRLLAFPVCPVIITAFDLTDVQTLEHTKQWLQDVLRENEAGSCFIFLVGTKKDLLSGAACEQAEAEAVHLANEMQAEYWSVSAKTGENVKAFFSRVAALAFEQSVLQDLEKRPSTQSQVGDGDGDLIRIEVPKTQEHKRPPGLGCC